MDKLHFIHDGFNESWKFFKTYNPKTEEDWERTMTVANEFCRQVKKQNEAVGVMFEKIFLAMIDYKEGENK